MLWVVRWPGKKWGIQTGDTETHVYFETEDIINANRMLCFSNLNLFYGSFNNVKLSWSRKGNAAPYLEKHTTMCSLGGRHHDFNCDPEKIHSQPVCPENGLAQTWMREVLGDILEDASPSTQGYCHVKCSVFVNDLPHRRRTGLTLCLETSVAFLWLMCSHHSLPGVPWDFLMAWCVLHTQTDMCYANSLIRSLL